MKKAIAFLLTLCMTLSLVACGSKTAAGSSAAQSAAQSTAQSTASEEEYTGPMSLEEVKSPTKDPFEKYDPAITVTTIHTANDGAFWFPEGDSIDNNIYTRRFADELGINYTIQMDLPRLAGDRKAEYDARLRRPARFSVGGLDHL